MRPSHRLAALLLLAPALPAQDLLGITWGGAVISVDTMTWNGTVVGLCQCGNQNGLARHPNGTYSAIEDGINDVRVHAIDMANASSTSVTTIPLPWSLSPRALAIDPGGNMFFWGFTGPEGQLWSVDLGASQATLVGTTPNYPLVHGLDFHPNGELYGWHFSGPSGGSGLIRIDTSNGQVTDVNTSVGSVVGGSIQTIAFRSDGALFGGQDEIYSIDIVTGFPTLLGGGSLFDLRGLEFDSPALGSSYCGPSIPNSSGGGASISASGSLRVNDNAFVLSATSLPQNQFGYFLASQTQGFVSGPGGSQGNLCLAGTLGRFTAQIQNTGGNGSIFTAIDLVAFPNPLPPVVVAGQTWNFQCWFRDFNPAGTSNFTEGLSVVFQ